MKKWIRTPLIRWILITLGLVLTFWALITWAMKDESVATSVTTLSSIPGVYDKNLLTHRLIMFDARYELANEKEINTALSNASFFLSEVKQDCNPDSDTQEFLQCANNILGKYFTYKETSLTSKGYSRQVSDCDLNVYLLLDAARLFNKQLHIVYSPGHAFIAYADARGITQYWETIEPDNHGQPAELWTSAYAKTLHPFFYTPQSEDTIEKIYPLFLLKELEEHKKDQLLSTLHEALQDNPLYLSAYYGNKKEINEDDAVQLLYLLQNDTHSFDKKIITARFFIDNKNNMRAMTLLNAIPKSKCEELCLIEKQRISRLYTPYVYMVENKIFKSEGMINTLLITILFILSGSIVVLTSIKLLVNKLFHITNKIRNNKKQKKNKRNGEQ